MRVLLIGDSGSIFIKQYIENVLLPIKNTEIVLIQENPSTRQYLDFYAENGIKVEPLVFKKNKFIFKIPVVRSYVGVKIWASYIKKRYGSFDMVHVHGLNRSRGNAMMFLKGISKRIAISVWGDEIFRASPKVCERYKKYYDVAGVITLSTKAMREKFVSVYGERYADKTAMNKFAVGIFGRIDKYAKECSKEQLCEEFGVKSPDKLVVFIGHNGRTAQRHIELTNALKKLPDECKDKITLVYTMTYGAAGKDYLAEMENEAISLGCEYTILKNFLNEDQMAKLRCLCDILLHAQLTDAFSASIQESLYAGCVVINGSWLPYNEIPDYKQSYVEYDNVEDIADVLCEVINNFEEYKTKFCVNRKILHEISSVETTTVAWRKNLDLK